MSIEIRNPAGPGDYAAAIEVMSTAFLERPDVDKVAASIATHWAPERTWIAWDGPRACGNFRSWATQLTIPGGATLQAAAVSAVSVLPTHRRRGILTRLATAAHDGMVESGDPLAILLASEYPIYGRYGYGPATRDAAISVRARETTLTGEPSGSVELAPLDAGTRDVMRGVYEAARLRVAGEMWRRDVTWNLDTAQEEDAFDGKRWRGFIALHRDAGGAVDGYARYTADPKWEDGPTGELDVLDLHTLDDAAYADLWRFLLSMDLVATVKAGHRPLSDPLPWLLTNPRAAGIGRVGDRLWVRILDLPRALEARAYERPARLVLEVTEGAPRSGASRWLLDAGPGGATCRATDASPDLTLPLAALGAAFLGGTRLRDAVRWTGADEHRADALAEADALFRADDEPWNSTFF